MQMLFLWWNVSDFETGACTQVLNRMIFCYLYCLPWSEALVNQIELFNGLFHRCQNPVNICLLSILCLFYKQSRLLAKVLSTPDGVRFVVQFETFWLFLSQLYEPKWFCCPEHFSLNESKFVLTPDSLLRQMHDLGMSDGCEIPWITLTEWDYTRIILKI